MDNLKGIVSFDSETPSWDNTGTEPSETVKSTGFKVGYMPSAPHFNWFFNRICKAVEEIKNLAINGKIGGSVYFNETETTTEPTVDAVILSRVQTVDTKTTNTFSTFQKQLGSIDKLNTSSKDCVVSAINSVELEKINYTSYFIAQSTLDVFKE